MGILGGGLSHVGWLLRAQEEDQTPVAFWCGRYRRHIRFLEPMSEGIRAEKEGMRLVRI
jgi:hypothetical protein